MTKIIKFAICTATLSAECQGGLRVTPTIALFLELQILPTRFKIEKRQLFFFKHLLGKDKNDPVQSVYFEQLKYVAEKNWANYNQD